MKRSSCILALSLCLIVLGLGGAVQADTINVRFAHISPPDPYAQPTSAYGETFKMLLEELTGGQVNVNIYPAGALGDQPSLLEQVERGSIEMSSFASGVLASALYEPLNVFDIPYLFRSTQVAWEATDLKNPFINMMAEELVEKSGLRIISIEPIGFRHFTNNVRPIRTPADMQGLRIRTMSVTPHIRMVEAMGGSAVPVDFTELYTSLQTGVVDGQENPFMNIIAESFYEVQDYITLDGHVLLLAITVVNDDWYQSLPEDVQSRIYEAAEGARIAATGLNFVKDVTGLDVLRSKGMEIYVPTAEELEEFRSISQPAVIDFLEGRIERSYIDGMLEQIQIIEEMMGY